MRTTAVRRDLNRDRHPLISAAIDIRDGFSYMLHTRWLLATLLFAILLVLVIMGPIEVLLPFAVKDQTGGGAGAFAFALAAFGIGGAAGSLVVASSKMPRRYLTLMILGWGVGCIPLAIIGFTDQLWVMVIALFICGFIFSGAQVLWGTLLQRRVPHALLGRVSSLDFFVSLALMPVSMAIAGPLGEAVGIAPAFLFAGLVPTLLAVATLMIARLGADELAHPMDAVADDDDVAAVEGSSAAG
jgi:MFS family permease